VISQNNLNNCWHGVVIAPKLDPFTNVSGLPNNMTPGQVIQYTLVSCNQFNTCTWAIGVSGVLMDHYMPNLDPANMFNASVEWDIIANAPFNYYFLGTMPNTPPRALTPLMFDGSTIGSSMVNLAPAGGMYTDCGYVPTSGPPIAIAPVSSLKDEETMAECRVYPNPASKTLIIEGGEAELAYTITDLSGRRIFSGRLQNGLTKVNVEILTDGFYLVQIEKLDKTTQVIKFVKAD
jgi:hypothetical protein